MCLAHTADSPCFFIRAQWGIQRSSERIFDQESEWKYVCLGTNLHHTENPPTVPIHVLLKRTRNIFTTFLFTNGGSAAIIKQQQTDIQTKLSVRTCPPCCLWGLILPSRGRGRGGEKTKQWPWPCPFPWIRGLAIKYSPLCPSDRPAHVHGMLNRASTKTHTFYTLTHTCVRAHTLPHTHTHRHTHKQTRTDTHTHTQTHTQTHTR